jgi:hypothetical protein
MNDERVEDIVRFVGLVAVIAGLMMAAWMLYGG